MNRVSGVSSFHRQRRALTVLALALLLHAGAYRMARHASPSISTRSVPPPSIEVRFLASPAQVSHASIATIEPRQPEKPASKARAKPSPQSPRRSPIGPVAESPPPIPSAPSPLAATAATVPFTSEGSTTGVSADAAPSMSSDAVEQADVGTGAAVSPVVPHYGRALLEPARSGRLQYGLHYGDYTQGGALAQLTLSFEIEDDGTYRMWTEGHAIGLTALFYAGSLTQASHGRVTQDGLQTLGYDERRGARAARSVEVDAVRGVVVLPDQRTVPTQVGMQDRLSTLMQLSLLARTQPDRFVPGASLFLPEMNFSGVEVVSYRSEGYETLPSAHGPLHAIHLVRQRPEKPDEPTIEIWLGYDQAMLPIRLRVTDRDGQVLDQMIKELP